MFGDYEPFGSQMPQAPPAQDDYLNMPFTFTQADYQELQKLQAGRATVQKQLSSGEISALDAQRLLAQLVPRLGSLEQRQQQTQKKAKEGAKAELMDQAALQWSMEMKHREMDADQIPLLKRSLINPVSGESADVMWNGQKWEQVDYGEALADMAPGEMGEMAGEQPLEGMPMGASSLATLGLGLGAEAPGFTGSAPGVAPDQPLSLEQFGAQMRGEAPTAQKPASQDPSTFEQTIQSGPFTEKYRGGKLVSSDRPAKGSEKDPFSLEAMQQYQLNAERAVRPLPPDAPPHLQLERQQQVNHLTRLQMNRALIAQEHRLKEQAAQLEHGRQEKVRLSQHEQKKEIDQKFFEQQLKMKHADLLLKQEELRNMHGGLQGISRKALSDIVGHVQGEVTKKYADDLKAEKDLPAIQRGAVQKRILSETRELVNERLGLMGLPPLPDPAVQGQAKGGGGQTPGEGKGPPPVDDQGKKFADAISDVIQPGGRPGVHPEKPGQEIGVERVRKLLPELNNAIHAMKGSQQQGAFRSFIGAPARWFQGKNPVDEPLSRMQEILDRAHTNNKALTADERARYEMYWEHLDKVLKSNGVENGASALKLKE